MNVLQEALHLSHDQRYSINIVDLADLFTVDSPSKVRTKLKSSAQKNKPFERYGDYKYKQSPIFIIIAIFSVNFHFLKNNKSYDRDFFTIHTLNGGLSFDRIESTLSSSFVYLVLDVHRIGRPGKLVGSASQNDSRLVSFERAYQTAGKTLLKNL